MIKPRCFLSWFALMFPSCEKCLLFPVSIFRSSCFLSRCQPVKTEEWKEMKPIAVRSGVTIDYSSSRSPLGHLKTCKLRSSAALQRVCPLKHALTSVSDSSKHVSPNDCLLRSFLPENQGKTCLTSDHGHQLQDYLPRSWR